MDRIEPLLRPVARHEDRIFRVTGWALLVFSIVAFSQKLVVVPDRIERYTPLVMVHGAAMLGWLVLFTTQAELAARGRMIAHKTFGAASALLVGLALWTGFIVSRDFSGEMDMIEVFLANLVHLSGLALFWAAGVAAALRHRIDIHRRMMLLAALAILSPPISRLTQTLGLPNGLAAAAHLGLVMMAPIAFDLAVSGKVHRATIVALVLVIVLSMLAAVVGLMPTTHALVDGYLGIAR